MSYKQDLIIDVDAMKNLVKTNREIIENSVYKLHNAILLKIKDYQRYELLSENAYQEQQINIMLNIIEMIEYGKSLIFESVLDSYNKFLKDGVDIKQYLKDFNDDRLGIIENVEHDLKKVGVISATTMLIFPNCIPLVAIINVPRVGIDFFLKKVVLNFMTDLINIDV